jgi:hypothetical protein
VLQSVYRSLHVQLSRCLAGRRRIFVRDKIILLEENIIDILVKEDLGRGQYLNISLP